MASDFYSIVGIIINPRVAKSLVMAMLYMPGPFMVTDLDAWFRPDGKKYALHVFPMSLC